MIVYDDHFLKNESILKVMLRVFEKRIIRILRLRSILWVTFSLSLRRDVRNVCMYVFVFLCWEETKSSFSNKIVFLLKLRIFCLLKSIFELINSFVCEYKMKEKVYFVDKIQKCEFTIALCYNLQKVHSAHYIHSDLKLFCFILIFCVVFSISYYVEFYLRLVSLSHRQNNRFK
jgi:uncharacterized membrane protein